MPDIALDLFTAHDVYDSQEGTKKWNENKIRFLAQGDSWFSIGAIPPWATSSILQKIELSYFASAINCAYPGRRLSQMDKWREDPGFVNLIAGKFAYKWSGILLSGGGNDLIKAIGVLPNDSDGNPIQPELRLLLNPGEWGSTELGAARYISDAGWSTFASYLTHNFNELLALRDSDKNKDVPLFCHTYAYPVPRDAPASRLFSFGPWLFPAVVAYQIPEADRSAVAKELIDRLAALLQDIVTALNKPRNRYVYLIDTRKALIPADASESGKSNDWENEIHPTPDGYKKLAVQWRAEIERQIPEQPG
jgi:hypothetical protein